MPRNNNRKNQATQAVRPEPDKKTPAPENLSVVYKVVLYAIFLVFKLIHFLSSFLPYEHDSKNGSPNAVNLKTDDGHVISISLPKRLNDALLNVTNCKEKLKVAKRQNTNLTQELKMLKEEHGKLLENFEVLGLDTYETKTWKKCQQARDSESRAIICNAIQQLNSKIEHLRQKCQYGIEDLYKIRDAQNQSAHVKEICVYHIASLEQFINWINTKMDYIKNFQSVINNQSIDNANDMLHYVDISELFSILHGAITFFFKKYYVILMLTIADKEYIEKHIQQKPYEAPKVAAKCTPAEKPATKTDVLAPKTAPKQVPQKLYETTIPDKKDWLYCEFTENDGEYHNLYVFLQEYLSYPPDCLVKYMDEVRKNNSGTFNNMTVFDIAKRIEKIAYKHEMYGN